MFVIVRCDTDREITSLGVKATKPEAQKVMKDDFDYWFDEKYGHERKKKGLTIDEMISEVEESDDFEDDFEIEEEDAYLNDCNHCGFAWKILEFDKIPCKNLEY
jgi:hypothetical protein